jgi:hypothetical protein
MNNGAGLTGLWARQSHEDLFAVKLDERFSERSCRTRGKTPHGYAVSRQLGA